MSPIERFFKLWPVGAMYGIFATPLGLLILAVGLLSTLSEGEYVGWVMALMFVLGSGIVTLAISLSDAGGDQEKKARSGRSFALSRISWLVRPPRSTAGRPSSGLINAPVPAFIALSLIAYFLILPLLVLWRAIELIFDRAPKEGDVISVEALDGSGKYWIAAASTANEHRVVLVVFVESDRRLRGYRSLDIQSTNPKYFTTLDEVRASHCRFVWRGPRHFWNPKVGIDTNDWSAIRRASKRVEELEEHNEI